MATINIRSVKLHTPEPLCRATGSGGGERAAAAATTTTGEKPSHIQSLFNFSRRQHQTLRMIKHSEWWLHIQWTKHSDSRYIH